MVNSTSVIRGWSLLEASFILALTVGAISIAFSIIQYAWTLRMLEASLDKVIYDSAVKPFVLRTDGGTLSVVIREHQLSDTVHSIADAAVSLIEDDLSLGEADINGRLFVEVAFAELNIDSQNGRAGGLRQSPFSFGTERGNQQLSSHGSANSLDDAFMTRVSESGNFPQSISGPISKYAVPVGIFGETQERRFLPSAVLLGGRAVYSLRDTLIGNLLEGFGMDPIVSAQKVVNLRGELQ